MLAAFPHADPLGGLSGGLLIGLAAALMLLGSGRIAGVSGITARGLGMGGGGSLSSSWLFLIGLPIGALIVAEVKGAPTLDYVPLPLLIIAGLIVGFGTRLGGGCTSGHGVCGVSRLSQRSLAATAIFMGTGILTVLAMRLMGLGT